MAATTEDMERRAQAPPRRVPAPAPATPAPATLAPAGQMQVAHSCRLVDSLGRIAVERLRQSSVDALIWQVSAASGGADRTGNGADQ